MPISTPKCIGLALMAGIIVASGNLARADHHQAPTVSLSTDATGRLAEGSLVDWFETRAGLDDRLVVSAICETEGERALIELAGALVLEEAFVFVPSDCLWIEIGYDESDVSVLTDLEDIQRLSRAFGPIAVYHIHPGRPADARRYFPAYGDLLNAMILSPGLRPQGMAEIRHRAVTSRGIIDYGFVQNEATEALIERMRATGLGTHIGPNLLLLYGGPARADLYYEAVRECDERIVGNPEHLTACFPMAVGEFLLDFRWPGEAGGVDIDTSSETGLASALPKAE